jgi:hypothetical protein
MNTKPGDEAESSAGSKVLNIDAFYKGASKATVRPARQLVMGEGGQIEVAHQPYVLSP